MMDKGTILKIIVLTPSYLDKVLHQAYVKFPSNTCVSQMGVHSAVSLDHDVCD